MRLRFNRIERVCGLSTKTEGKVAKIIHLGLSRQQCLEKKAKH
jgi:hypothetical protein